MNESNKSAPGTSARPWFNAAPLNAFKQEMNDLFENFFGNSLANFRHEIVPRADVVELPDAVEVKIDLPGYKTEEIQVELGENCLTVTARREESPTANDPQRRYHRAERRCGTVSRSVWLPCAVNEEQIEAQLADGVLTVSLPKAETAKRRTVPVKSTPSPESHPSP